MPAWVRKSVQKKTVQMSASATPVPIAETDPALTAEIAAADDQRGFVNVEALTSGATLYVYRWEGARPDLLRRLDPAGTAHLTLTSVGIFTVGWSTPAGAARKLVVEGHITPGSGSVTFEIDDVYRVQGS